ncbi:MAG: hypothetical protein L3K14_01960 [Thermoplasmata archaeon]|nr:hypothetical protein [Thermoplasmata archaeon]
MTGVAPVPAFKSFSPSMRVDAFLGDWRASLPPELSPEEREAQLYAQAWTEYLVGDYGFGLWCWHETDRLTNSFGRNVKEVTRVLGPGRFFGFSHRRAVAERVPLDRIHRPRKGEMSTPRPEAIVLANYQLLCTYLVHARQGDPKAKAQYEIALLDLEDRQRTDPYLRFFETFRDLLERSDKPPPEGGGPH